MERSFAVGIDSARPSSVIVNTNSSLVITGMKNRPCSWLFENMAELKLGQSLLFELRLVITHT